LNLSLLSYRQIVADYAMTSVHSPKIAILNVCDHSAHISSHRRNKMTSNKKL
jgi:hypothetical protein